MPHQAPEFTIAKGIQAAPTAQRLSYSEKRGANFPKPDRSYDRVKIDRDVIERALTLASIRSRLPGDHSLCLSKLRLVDFQEAESAGAGQVR
jgi:hypothetical protein